ncbi:carbohydrate binding family 9 domain-containing protein [bacterium]|nr:carbohydrate binding family 9 domain-containing protein [bacterium]
MIEILIVIENHDRTIHDYDPRLVMLLYASMRVLLQVLLFCAADFAFCATAQIVIPRISHRIGLDDFEEMRPRASLLGKMAVIEDFVQSTPSDGAPASQKTIVYVAYDDTNLYVIFVCFDSNPERIAASISRREGFSEDEDWVEFYLDTFNDQRRAYCFSTNALGVQWDSRYSETSGSADSQGGHQASFDALWRSEGKLTGQGYIVSMTVPFKSIRFPSEDSHTWRILFGRSIARSNEYSAWPHMSRSIQGYLTQSSLLTGLKNISPGKSLQLIPYTTFRSFRLLERETDPPGFLTDRSDAAAGLDPKFVLKDSNVFDLAVNPDFSQVESDEPQVTVNQRFEVFFREKRPFFLENAQYFETPLNLVFTRRMADPQLGGRFTGKQGPYTLGFLYTNDEAPGKIVPESSPLFDSKANFAVVRLTRDFLSQSSIGLLFTSRNFEGEDNYVLGSDFRFRLGDHWQATGQAVRSWNDPLDGSKEPGAAYLAQLKRAGRKFELTATYEDISPEFRTHAGFIPRLDFRETEVNTHYYFRPEGEVLIAWGPELTLLESWDYDGTRLDSIAAPGIFFELKKRTNLRLEYFDFHQRLRPIDFPVLQDNVDFSTPAWRLEFQTSYWKWATLEMVYEAGKDINFVPPSGQIPFRADRTFFSTGMVLRPLRRLQLRNNYFFTALRAEDSTIFNDHIVSIRANYQFTRAFSLRVILQYETTIASSVLTSLEDRRNLNADVLFTYLLNPWTALYVGYNGNRQNLSLIEENGLPHVIRTRGAMLNDANQFFLKFSYLFRL